MTNQGYNALWIWVKHPVDAKHRYDILFHMKHHDPILSDVYRAYGTAANLARCLGVTRQAVSQWHKVPLKYVRRIAEYTGISAAVLRPDIYEGIS